MLLVLNLWRTITCKLAPLSSLKRTSKFQIIVQLAAISRHVFNPIYHYVGLPTSFFSESKIKSTLQHLLITNRQTHR